MIEIENGIFLDEKLLSFQFIRSSGPGGQNVNKVSSAVQLRIKIDALDTLPERAKSRIKELAGSKLTNDGEIIIEAQRFRSQDLNKQDAVERLLALLRKSLERKKFRVKTKPSKTAKKKRVDNKKKRGDVKKMRQKPSF